MDDENQRKLMKEAIRLRQSGVAHAEQAARALLAPVIAEILRASTTRASNNVANDRC
jgi:hypothetical protein